MRRKGFGILEVLLAGVIIITMLSALVFLGRSAINNSVYLQQRAQATYLAQEGMEIVRQIRDSNYIDGNNTTKWNTLRELNTGVGPGMIYQIGWTDQYSGRYFLIPISDNPKNINIDGTDFTRTIEFATAENLLTDPVISNFSGDKNDIALRAIVKVTFDSFGEKKVEVEELIANSRQGF